MSGFGLTVPDSLRAGVRGTLMQNGIPPAFVDEIADLAVLAAADALAAIDRTVSRGSDSRVRMTAINIALGTTAALCETYADTIREAAEHLGMRTINASVTLGGGAMSLLPESIVPADLRASIRAQIAAIPHAKANEQADLIADLTVHAVKEAIAAIDRVASQGPNLGVRMAVLSGAISSTQSLLGNVEKALRAYAVEAGGQIYAGMTNITGAEQ